jgi:hypothetical protein
MDNPNTADPDETAQFEALNTRAIWGAGGSRCSEVVIDLHGQATPLDENRTW